jgi:hypothetical protein
VEGVLTTPDPLGPSDVGGLGAVENHHCQ